MRFMGRLDKDSTQSTIGRQREVDRVGREDLPLSMMDATQLSPRF
jgi:hypothetical protein